jgi:hypothetical protein
MFARQTGFNQQGHIECGPFLENTVGRRDVLKVFVVGAFAEHVSDEGD